jgi:hypothetical protein
LRLKPELDYYFVPLGTLYWWENKPMIFVPLGTIY